MKNDEFNSIIKGIQDRLYNTLVVKGAEYSRNEDRLHNFNVGSTITSQTRERVLDGFMTKHYISYRDMLNDLEQGKLPTVEYLEEKVGDLMVYLMLFEASVKEKIRDNGEKATKTNTNSRIFTSTSGLLQGG